MSTAVFETVYTADDYSLSTTSTDYHSFICQGDTIMLAGNRAPLSSASGNKGEICIGDISGVTYLFYYNGTNWLRCPFSTY